MIIKEIKNKIDIISNINKLTNTLSMISLSKMKKYLKIILILNNLFNNINFFFNYIKIENKFLFCLIIISTNKGLCGSINNEIIKKTINLLKLNNNIDFFIVGKKAYDYFFKKNFLIKNLFLFKDNENIENIKFPINIINNLLKYKNITFIFNKIINNNIKVLKINLYEYKNINYISKFNFNKKKFLIFYFNFFLKYTIMNNIFCELKSRMITMKSASDNSKKILKEMKILKNKIRQFKVTQDMLEIINGSL
uniref:ATP synthase gamma subunit n=1 Tax=Carsonella ruddii TaxID=114186 RepID=Q93U65_CARRU|nr:ATP synthase gamma subunit [Candidatus Carsonella ruddii]